MAQVVLEHLLHLQRQDVLLLELILVLALALVLLQSEVTVAVEGDALLVLPVVGMPRPSYLELGLRAYKPLPIWSQMTTSTGKADSAQGEWVFPQARGDDQGPTRTTPTSRPL